jgi:hypothetical protein
MPVTCTSTPKVLRVDYLVFEDEIIRREAVCYLRPTAKGKIDILYSHHIDHHRVSESAPWEHAQTFKMQLTPALMSDVTGHVIYEFWSAFGMTVRDLPWDGTIDVRHPEPQLQGSVKFART